MKFAAVVLLLSCLAFSQARFLEDEWDSESEELVGDLYDQSMDYSDLESDLDSDLDHKGGHCICCPHGCWCHGTDDGLRVSVTFMVDETVQKEKSTQIIADVTVDKTQFSEKFAANQLDDFCKTVEGKKICFDFDIKDKKPKAQQLKGCVKLTSPKKVDLGCFKLPLLDDVDYDVTGSEIESEGDDDTLYDDETLYFERN